MKKHEVEQREKEIYEIIKQHDFINPTQIGLLLGFTKENASGRLAEYMKKLVKKKLIQKTARGYKANVQA